MPKPALHQRPNNALALLAALQATRSRVDEQVAARNELGSSDVDESDRLGVSGLEANCSTGGDVEAAEEGEGAVEAEGAIRLGEVIVRSDLRARPRLAATRTTIEELRT